MKTSELAKQAVRSGITPVELAFYAASGFEEDDDLILRSQLVLHSLELGTLTPAQYRFVARRTKQGDALVERHLQKLLAVLPALLERHKNLLCVTVPVFPRMLKEGRLTELLFKTLSADPRLDPKRLCLELSADILFEEQEPFRRELKQLRALGLQLAVCEAGEDSCPLARLASLAPQYIFMDSLPLSALEAGDEAVDNLIRYLRLSGSKVYAPQLPTQSLVDAARLARFDGCTASQPFEEVAL